MQVRAWSKPRSESSRERHCCHSSAKRTPSCIATLPSQPWRRRREATAARQARQHYLHRPVTIPAPPIEAATNGLSRPSRNSRISDLQGLRPSCSQPEVHVPSRKYLSDNFSGGARHREDAPSHFDSPNLRAAVFRRSTARTHALPRRYTDDRPPRRPAGIVGSKLSETVALRPLCSV